MAENNQEHLASSARNSQSLFCVNERLVSKSPGSATPNGGRLLRPHKKFARYGAHFLFTLTLRQWLRALSSGILQVLIFPSPAIFPLSWIALAPLLVAILQPRSGNGDLLDSLGRNLNATTPWQGFLLAYLGGVLWYAGTCYWVFHTMRLFGGLDTAAAVRVCLCDCLSFWGYDWLFGWVLDDAE